MLSCMTINSVDSMSRSMSSEQKVIIDERSERFSEADAKTSRAREMSIETEGGVVIGARVLSLSRW